MRSLRTYGNSTNPHKLKTSGNSTNPHKFKQSHPTKHKDPIILNSKEYKYMKTFSKGIHAGSVELWKHYSDESVGDSSTFIVRKQYRPRHKNIYMNEINQLLKLQSCNFIPKLYQRDDEKLVLWMQFCGKPITNLSKHRDEIQKMKSILKRVHGLYHNDIKIGNVTQSNNKLYLIDLGWTYHMKISPGYRNGKFLDSKFLNA